MRTPPLVPTLALVLTLAATAPPVAAQNTLAPRHAPIAAIGHRSPLRARVIGLVPGLGHVYAGSPARGGAFLGGMFAVLLVGGSISDAQCEDPQYTDEYCSSETLDIVTAVAAGGVWAWSIADAGWTAERANRRGLGRVEVVVRPSAMPRADGSRTLALSTALVLRR